MSTAAVAWAARQHQLDPSVRWTLYALAEHAAPDGSGAWPAKSRVAAMTGQSTRTVARHLSELEAAGLIRRGRPGVIPADHPGNRRPVVWDLSMDLRDVQVGPVWPVDNLLARGDTYVTPVIHRGDTQRRLGVTQLCHPNQELNPSTHSSTYSTPDREAELCTTHGLRRSRYGLCSGCAADSKAAR